MRFQRVSNSMVRANLNVMGRPAKKMLSNYAKRNGLTVHEATRRALGFVREFEKRSGMELYDEPGFTPLVTFIGVKQPHEPIFIRAVSSAEHGKIPIMPRMMRFNPAKKDRRPAYLAQRLYVAKHEKELYKKPITKAEFLASRKDKIGGAAYKYCTTYPNDCVREAIKFLEKKPASTNILSRITHETREILDPYISSETSLHWKGPDPKDKRIAQSVYLKLQKEYK